MDILVIDDNPLIQQVATRFLGRMGYQVAVVGTAAEGLAQARLQPPALLIIDMHLPDKDGPEALAELRTLPGCAAIPAIGISGLEEHDAPPGAVAQFSAYLTKPVDLDVLERTVRQYLSAPQDRHSG